MDWLYIVVLAIELLGVYLVWSLICKLDNTTVWKEIKGMFLFLVGCILCVIVFINMMIHPSEYEPKKDVDKELDFDDFENC